MSALARCVSVFLGLALLHGPVSAQSLTAHEGDAGPTPRMSSVHAPWPSTSAPDESRRGPVIALYEISTARIRYGEFAHLAWRVENAARVLIENRPVPPFGDVPVAPSSTTEYRLVAYGEGIKREAVVRLEVVAPPPVPRIEAVVDPAEIVQGESARIGWLSENATSLTLDGRPVNQNGVIDAQPAESREYVFRAEGEGGVSYFRLPLRVRPAPPVRPALPPAPAPVLFGFGESRLDRSARARIRSIASMLADRTDLVLVVVGHADSRGANDRNRGLGLKRAEAVRDELARQGVHASRIVLETRGEEEPAAPNERSNGRDNPEGRRLNRRVEFVFR